MDERRRFDRNRPRDADITRTHNALAAKGGVDDPEVDDAASLPEAVEPHATEPTSGDRPGRDARDRVLRALRLAVSGGGGRSRNRTREYRTVPQVAAEPPATVAETHHEPAPVVRDVTHVQISEEFRGLPELAGEATPHWSERDNRGRRYQDPAKTDGNEHATPQ